MISFWIFACILGFLETNKLQKLYLVEHSMTKPGSVQFALSDRNLRLFKVGLQSLNKICNDQVILEATPQKVCPVDMPKAPHLLKPNLKGLQLLLRSINSTQSAYMVLTFSVNFFDAYDVYDTNVVQAGLLFKFLLSVFRTLKIAKLVFELGATDSFATITLFCENGLKKTYRIPATEVDVLQIKLNRDSFPVHVAANAELLSRLLTSFQSGVDDVNILAQPPGNSEVVLLRSCIDPEKRQKDRSLITEIVLESRSEVLLHYKNTGGNNGVSSSFSLKDFKAMLGLCEALHCGISIYVQSVGQPVLLEPYFDPAHAINDIESELIMATTTRDMGYLRASRAQGNVRTPGSAAVKAAIASPQIQCGSISYPPPHRSGGSSRFAREAMPQDCTTPQMHLRDLSEGGQEPDDDYHMGVSSPNIRYSGLQDDPDLYVEAGVPVDEEEIPSTPLEEDVKGTGASMQGGII